MFLLCTGHAGHVCPAVSAPRAGAPAATGKTLSVEVPKKSATTDWLPDMAIIEEDRSQESRFGAKDFKTIMKEVVFLVDVQLLC